MFPDYRLFNTIDKNDDQHLSRSELRALIVGIHFNEIDLDENDVVDKVMKEFDTTHDSKVSLGEFIDGVERWLQKAKGAKVSKHADLGYIDYFHEVLCHLTNISIL